MSDGELSKYLPVEDIELLIAGGPSAINFDEMGRFLAHAAKSAKLSTLMDAAVRADRESIPIKFESVKVALFIGYQLGFAAAKQ